MTEKITLTTLQAMKKAGERIASLTAYDAAFARCVDEAGVEVVLVGDSLGMVLHGEADTLGVTLGDMIYHSRLVARAVQRAMVVTDMPYLSYTTPAQALGNAGRLMREGGAEVVKMEGGAWLAETVQLLGRHGIPVCAHLGLTPQSIYKLGGYRVQGRDPAEAAAMLEDARQLQQAGATMLVLECVPAALAGQMRAQLDIPVIGIGAGADCDGQVLVLHDVLGVSERVPRFARDFLEDGGDVRSALRLYVEAVRNGSFPGPEEKTPRD
jgi:3-methyl-2-oxobutanoate hydroxymethyltransferase